MKPYYCDSSGWFVVLAATKRIARSFAVAEFGRGNVRTVREATESEVKEYLRWSGREKLEPEYYAL